MQNFESCSVWFQWRNLTRNHALEESRRLRVKPAQLTKLIQLKREIEMLLETSLFISHFKVNSIQIFNHWNWLNGRSVNQFYTWARNADFTPHWLSCINLCVCVRVCVWLFHLNHSLFSLSSRPSNGGSWKWDALLRCCILIKWVLTLYFYHLSCVIFYQGRFKAEIEILCILDE